MAQNKEAEAAFAFLGTVRKKDVSILESAILLQALAGAYRSHRITARLYTQLQEVCTEDWIRTNSLATVFAVANALHAYDEDAIHGRRVGVLAQRLMATEKTPGGPYADTDTEPEMLANSLIAVFAGWAAGTLPGTRTYLRQQIANGLHSSLVPEYILQRYVALIDGFQSVDVQTPPIVDSVLSATAVLWESPVAPETEKPVLDDDSANAAIFALAAEELEKLGLPLRDQATAMLERISQANKQYEIALLPRYFQAALKQDTASDAVRLGAANLYCWLAYMAYDRMLDDNEGIDLLPLANIAQRKALGHYRHCVPQAESLVEAVFTRMDQANAWERTHARAAVHNDVLSITELPDYGTGQQLATRSFGHVLGPMLIAIEGGQQLRSEPLQTLRTAFSHYLIARQLNDDAHDWQDDIAAGQLTFVVTKLLHTQNMTSSDIDLKVALPELQQHFRKSTSQEIAKHMSAHIAKAKELFQQSGLVKPDSMLEHLCDNLEASAQRMTLLSKESEDLLSTF